ESLRAERIVMGDMDRGDSVEKGWPLEVAKTGARLAIDHVGSRDSRYIDDAARVALILELIEAGYVDRIILSSSATGVSFGEPGNDLPYSNVLTKFVPMLEEAGVSSEHIRQMLASNTVQLLSVSGENQ
ncbi:phosphotriesterase, partial [Halomonas sp. KAO]|uniref:phosphotriesterase family protein n=1 Tax=Halomonas sp. KAO TaxID=2783858 RepID=UPI001E5AEF6B